MFLLLSVRPYFRRFVVLTTGSPASFVLNNLMVVAQAAILAQETSNDKKLYWQKVYDLTREKRDKLEVEWSMRDLPICQIDDFD